MNEERVGIKDIFLKGIFKENPILVNLLGICPALAITTSFQNALAMGISFIFVLVFSNIIISLMRKLIPYEIRIPIYIVIIATFVTVVDLLLQAFLIDVYDNLGIFISLIVVNCVVLGRVESFASKNNVIDSIFDGLGVGFGYTLILCLVASIREFLGSGVITIWSDLKIDVNQIFRNENNIRIFSKFFLSPAGAFIVLGVIIGIFNAIKNKRSRV